MFKQILAAAIILTLSAATGAQPITPQEHIRGGDQTYLTFPEWFLVHSPTELAGHLKDGKASHFPYFDHIGQLWNSYGVMYDRVSEEFPFNGEYHTMIMVIGVSTTAEYGAKGLYERTIGRLAEATMTGTTTEEDKVAHEEAQKYAEFILLRPWYEFDYLGSLANLWGNTSFFGPDMVRKLERKYVLTSEYLVKAVYAWLIGQGAAASFDAPVHYTAVITPDNSAKMLPRYRPFTHAAVEHALAGGDFKEIAGNSDMILVSLLGSPTWKGDSLGGNTLFTQQIITKPGQIRHVVEVPISQLGNALRQLADSDVQLEHIYDF